MSSSNGLVAVAQRKRTEAEGAEEFVFVEDGGEQAFEARAVEEGEEVGAVLVGDAPALGDLGEVGAAVDEPPPAVGQGTTDVGEFVRDRFDGEEGDQTGDGAEFDRDAASVGEMELVVVEAFLFIPEIGAARAAEIERGRDVEEVHEELARERLVGEVGAGEFEGDEEHVEREHGHPAGAVALHEVTAVGRRFAAVEGAGVVEAEKPAAEDLELLVARGGVGPPSEVDEQGVEDVLEENAVRRAGAAGVGEVGAQGGPGVDRRVGVAEVPLVGGEASVGMHIPFLEQELELVLGQRGVGEREGDGVEGEVPAGEPRVFPIVGHRYDIMRDEVAPLGVARIGAFRRRESGVAVEPFADVVVVEHFVPLEAGEGLALDVAFVRTEGGAARSRNMRRIRGRVAFMVPSKSSASGAAEALRRRRSSVHVSPGARVRR